MTSDVFEQLLNLLTGAALLCAFLVVWRHSLRAIAWTLAFQGAAVAAVAVALGLHHHHYHLLVAAAVLTLVKAIALPIVVSRAAERSAVSRESQPIVNIPSALLLGGFLTLVAQVGTQSMARLGDPLTGRLLPLAVSIVLLGFLVMVTRRNAISQVAGFLVFDNGITLFGLLATGGLPLVVELGASLDLFLAVFVLQMIASRMAPYFEGMDLDTMTEVKD